MGSEAERKSSYTTRKYRFYTSLCITSIIIAIVLCQLASDIPNNTTSSLSEQSSGTTKLSLSLSEHSEAKTKLNLTELKKCSTSFTPSKGKSEWNTKPIWIPGYPTSLDEVLHKNIVKNLTKMHQGGKSFYASSKNSLRFCYGKTETATCSVVHPLITMNGGPGKRYDKFYRRYIMAIRNPMTAIPAYVNFKDIKYHKGVGQMKEEAWRKLRDEYFTDLINEWKNFLVSWKNEDKYELGMYLVHEDLYDAEKGPVALASFREILSEAGFDVTPMVDIPCIWFNSIGEDQIQQKQTKHYEYNDYIPGYTETQKELLLSTVTSLIDQYSDDDTLSLILQRYYDSINQNIRIDREYTPSD